jgi:predicted amidohydrolase YtcJ
MFKTMNSADILISNGIVLTLDNKNSQIKNGSVAIKKDKIVAMGDADEFAAWEVMLKQP